MSDQKYLIDTNVFIGLEDDCEISPKLSTLTSLAGKHNVGLFVHEAARDDIHRDRNVGRRRISLSKVDKFQQLHKVRDLSEDDLSQEFGPLAKPNDVVDATLLHSLRIGAADFLVTEDRGLHERARRYVPDLARQVLFIADAVLLLKTTYEPINVPVRFVEEVEAYQIPLDDDIFDSLREGYPEFDDWWRRKCVATHRKCWVVFDDGLAGLVVRKDETADDTDAQTPAEKILKVCTFKVRPEKRGTKLGELLLKQVFWFAQTNGYDLVYLTVYPEQQALIDLLEYYGFQQTADSEDGECTYEKRFSRNRLIPDPSQSLFKTARVHYPRFCTGPNIPTYGIPIREAYHDHLFPELKTAAQPDLFDGIGLGSGPKRPGNTIRKVYLCRAQANIVIPGALLFFYKGRSQNAPSQSMTTIGVFEDMTLARSTSELRKLAGGRSVYSDNDITKWAASANRPVKVINYLLAGYIEPPMDLESLLANGIFAGHPPQSIFKLSRDKQEVILKHLRLGFEL